MTEFLPCPAFNIECQYVAEVDRLSADNERLRDGLDAALNAIEFVRLRDGLMEDEDNLRSIARAALGDTK